ncbi:hypothetical protein ACFY8P_06450 [Streptomyces sp. NPDC012693]|uniref:hypothetical protein n=1 Tax=Streptomyces sp. NPDC012693 TaxID=3364844 RepID=UPI0036C36C01
MSEGGVVAVLGGQPAEGVLRLAQQWQRLVPASHAGERAGLDEQAAGGGGPTVSPRMWRALAACSWAEAGVP